MKALPILTLAALAAFVPGAHASGGAIVKSKGGLNDVLTSGLVPEILSKLPTLKDVGSCALVSRSFKKIVEEFCKKLPIMKGETMFKSLRLGTGDDRIAILQFLAKHMKHPNNRHTLFLRHIINYFGHDKLLKEPALAQEIALLLLRPSSGGTGANVIADVTVTVDPYTLLQLRRAAGPDPILDALFAQNVEAFKGGLGVGRHWLDNLEIDNSRSNDLETSKLWKGGILEWFVKEYLPNDPHLAIRFSRDDISSFLGLITFLHPKLQVLNPKPSLTQADLTAITVDMFNVLTAIYTKLKYKPSLEELILLVPGPVARLTTFDITAGFKAYLRQSPSPSPIQLLHALSGLLDNPNVNFNHPNFDIFKSIIFGFIYLAAMDAEDMMWLTGELGHSILRELRHDALTKGFRIICNDDPESHTYPDCSQSDYVKTVPNGILGWHTQAQQILMLVNEKAYAEAHWRLTEIGNFHLIPTRLHDGTQRVLFILQNAVDGNDLIKAYYDEVADILNFDK